MVEQNDSLSPQKTAVAPQKTAVAPQKTAVAPQKTAAAPQKTAAAPQQPGMAAPFGVGTHAPGATVKVGGNSYTVEKLMGSGSEGDIYVVSDRKRKYALKLCHSRFYTNVKVMPALQKLNGQGYIADIVDYGDDYELLEYIPGGSVASAGLKGNAEAILTIAAKTAMSLSFRYTRTCALSFALANVCLTASVWPGFRSGIASCVTSASPMRLMRTGAV